MPVKALAKAQDAPVVRILDPRTGQPFIAQPQRRALALNGNSNIPFDGAGYGSHFEHWQPFLSSPDGEINVYRDRLISRVRDLVRNDGWASGAVSRLLDNTIGATFRPISKPDYRALKAATGIKAFDAKWADEYARAINAHWRSWAEDPAKYCDMQRSMSLNQLFRLGFRHKLVDGDACAQIVYMPRRMGYGRARYGTAVNLIDPDRLSNPFQNFDTITRRGGVQISEYDGSAVGYWVRRAHQNDFFAMAQSIEWDYIPRETSWGRPIFVHDYDRTRAGEHRGAGGVFAPILDRFRMLSNYDRAELDAAIINATFAAFIESPMDRQLVEEAVGDQSFDVDTYQDLRSAYHGERKLAIGGSRMLSLFPGEKVGMIDAERPSGNYPEFQKAFIRNCASALGMTEQQFSQDWTSVNFSSARAALLEVWKTTTRRRSDFGFSFGMPIRFAFMEESHELDDLPLPAGAPDFIEFRAAYARCIWAGPGRGYPDPVADREGAVLAMTSGLSTLEDETLEGSGGDWEENLERRAVERDKYDELKLPQPEWLGAMGVGMGQPNKGGSHDPKSPNYRSSPGAQEK